MSRWVSVTEKALKVYKGKCNAITCCNKPLVAIPLAAIKKVERVHFELPINKKDLEKNAEFLENQFEIFLKDGFLDIYLPPDYDKRMKCSHS